MSDFKNTLPSSLASTVNRRSGLALLFASAVAIGSLMAPGA
ncbi:metal ABC transporter substrate-binding protein, partial [Mesorhizobium sp. M7A.F.Ca.MR.148.00.0.0]